MFVANLQPVKLCGVESNGMILSADNGTDAEGNESVKVIMVDESIHPGAKLR